MNRTPPRAFGDICTALLCSAAAILKTKKKKITKKKLGRSIRPSYPSPFCRKDLDERSDNNENCPKIKKTKMKSTCETIQTKKKQTLWAQMEAAESITASLSFNISYRSVSARFFLFLSWFICVPFFIFRQLYFMARRFRSSNRKDAIRTRWNSLHFVRCFANDGLELWWDHFNLPRTLQ